MRKPCFFIVLLFVLNSLFAADAENATGWRGPRHDGISVIALQAPAAWPKKLTFVWQADAGFGFSTPVCDGVNVYLQYRTETDEFIGTFDAASGTKKWETKLTEFKEAQTHEPAATPDCGVPGALFVHSMTGAVFKLDTKDGNIVWKRDLPKEWKGEFRPMYGVAASPILDDKNILLQIGDKETGKAIALKQSDGTNAWEQAVGAPGYGSFMPLVLGGKACRGVLLFQQLAVFKKDGEKYAPAFTFDFPGGTDGNAATPVPLGDDRVLLTNVEETVALKVAPGAEKCEELWRAKKGGNLASPVFANGRIYLHTGSELVCLDPANGKILSSLDSDTQYCALLAWGNVLFCRLHDGTLKLADIQKENLKWLAEYPATAEDSESWSSPIPVSPTRLVMRAGKKLLCLTWEK